jgi:hypothetical protein
VPFFAGVAASIFFGWLILFAGVAHLVYASSQTRSGTHTLADSDRTRICDCGSLHALASGCRSGRPHAGPCFLYCR